MYMHVVCMQILYLLYACSATNLTASFIFYVQASTFTVLGRPRLVYRWQPAAVLDLTTPSPS